MWTPKRNDFTKIIEGDNIPVIKIYRMLQYLGMNGTFTVSFENCRFDSDCWAVSYVAFKRRLKGIREEFHKEYWEKYRRYNSREQRRNVVKMFKEKLKGHKKVCLYKKDYLNYVLIIE